MPPKKTDSSVKNAFWMIDDEILCQMDLPIQQVVAANNQRPLQPEFLEKLEASIDQYEMRRTYPIHVVLPESPSSDNERDFINKISRGQLVGLEDIPEAIRFISIDGWHRMTASREHVRRLNRGVADERAWYWPAKIYPFRAYLHPFSVTLLKLRKRSY
jgi:hypothetical protein